MGEDQHEKANRYFSLFVYVSFGLGVVIMILGLIFIRPIAALLGAEGAMLDDCVVYGRIILLALPICILQMEFQSFFVTAEKPKLGLFVTVASGVTNMVLDALLVAVIPMGLIGAALATALSPVVGYHYGAKNHPELKSLLHKSLLIYGVVSVCMVAFSLILAKPLSGIFVGYDDVLLEMTIRGFRVFSFSYLFSGFAIFASSFFTALNDGLISAVISFMRTVVFQVAAVLILPLIWELDGIWIFIVVAEALAVVVSAVLLKAKQEKYQY